VKRDAARGAREAGPGFGAACGPIETGAHALPRALLVAVAAGAAAAVIAYAVMRVVERTVFLEPNPAMLIWADHDPFLWRAAIALYLGGACAFGGHAIAARSPQAAARGLLALVATAAAAIVVQGAIFP
jgi:hypothetical protein